MMSLEDTIYSFVDTGACEESIIKDIQEYYPDTWTDEKISQKINELLKNDSLIDRGAYLVRNYKKMKYKVFLSSNHEDKIFNSLDEAKTFIKQIDSEYRLVNDDINSHNGYRCRYLWGGYREGIQAFIVEVK